MGLIKKIYNVGIIGYGGMGSNHYKHISAKQKNCKVKGVFDVNPSRMQVACEKGLKAYKSCEELINDPQIDIIVVATTNDSHKDICIAALHAGKNVICEKPVTVNSKDLKEIIEVAAKSDGLFTIDQNRRVNFDFVLAKRQIESGILGDVYVIESRVEGSRGMPSGWRTIKKLGGGMMLDWGVHLIDQIMYMIDEPVVNVFCKMYSIQYSDIDDNFRLTMTFKSGLTAHIEVSTNNYIMHPRWYVLGKDGTMQIDDWECNGKITRRKDEDDVWAEEIVYTAAGPTKTMAPRNPNTTETIKLSMPKDVVNDLSGVYNQLIDAIEKKAELTITPQQALRVIKVMEAAFLSAETDEAVKANI